MVPRLSQRAVVVGISLVGSVLPFDLAAIIWSFRDQNVRPVHAFVVLLLASTITALRGLKTSSAESLGSGFDRLALALAGLLVLSAVFAEEHQVVATVSLRRLLTGLALAVAVRRATQRERDVRLIMCGLVLGGTLACLLGFYLLAGLPGAEIGAWFRGRTIMFGPTRRLTLPFAHANVAGVYLGANLILALGLAAESLRRPKSPDWLTRLYGACCLILGVGLTLTLSRSAILATGAILLILVVAMTGNGRWIFGGALLLIVVVVLTNPAWRSRIADPGHAHWYQVEIVAPDSFDPSSPPETILLKNRSEVSWPQSEDDDGLVAISLDERGVELGRALFPLIALAPSLDGSVGSDDGVLVDVSNLVVDDGAVVIVWDVYRQGQGHFRGLTGQPVVASSVSGQPFPEVIKPGKPFRPGISGLDPVPGRTKLWSAANTLALERPLLGVGPGNFRLHYQRALDVNGPLTTHAHSILFEPLASWGIPATAVFLFLILRTGLGALRAGSGALRAIAESLDLAVMAAFALVVLANLADWTIASTSGGLLFWLLLGLVARISPHIYPEAR